VYLSMAILHFIERVPMSTTFFVWRDRVCSVKAGWSVRESADSGAPGYPGVNSSGVGSHRASSPTVGWPGVGSPEVRSPGVDSRGVGYPEVGSVASTLP
jgi:hypothetical protein